MRLDRPLIRTQTTSLGLTKAVVPDILCMTCTLCEVRIDSSGFHILVLVDLFEERLPPLSGRPAVSAGTFRRALPRSVDKTIHSLIHYLEKSWDGTCMTAHRQRFEPTQRAIRSTVYVNISESSEGQLYIFTQLRGSLLPSPSIVDFNCSVGQGWRSSVVDFQVISPATGRFRTLTASSSWLC